MANFGWGCDGEHIRLIYHDQTENASSFGHLTESVSTIVNFHCFHYLKVGLAPKIDSTQENLIHMRIDFFAITVGSNLTTLASSGLEISCPVTGFPKPVIQWYREGVPVQSGMMLNVDEDTGTLFTLSISHRKGGMFTCEASNTLGSDRASSVITVLGRNIYFFIW